MITLLFFSWKRNEYDIGTRYYYCDDFCQGPIFWTGNYTTATDYCIAPATPVPPHTLPQIPTPIPPQTLLTPEPAQTAYPAQTIWAAPTAYPG